MTVSRMSYIEFPSTLFQTEDEEEYVDSNFLKKMYDSIQIEVQ